MHAFPHLADSARTQITQHLMYVQRTVESCEFHPCIHLANIFAIMEVQAIDQSKRIACM